jgi:hypothetical protein
MSEAAPWRDHTVVFICGLHRSGTSQLHSALASDTQVSGLLHSGVPHDEGQHLQDVYPTARAHGGPGRFAFDPRSHLTEKSPIATPDAARRLFSQWGEHWDLSSRVLIEKSPPNLVRMRFLQALFPDARFVIIVRHPVVTTLATRKLATTWWMRRTFRKASLAEIARHWFAAHRLMIEDFPQVHHKYLLRWEDLCAETGRTLDDVAAFVGIDGQFEMPVLDPQVDQRYIAQWAQMTGSAEPDRETTALLSVFRQNEDLAARFGYSLTDLRALGPVSI